MDDDRCTEQGPGDADDLLRRALLEPEAAASVALRSGAWRCARRSPVIFHGRRDLGTVQTYVTHGGHGAGDAVAPPTCCGCRATWTWPTRTPAARPEELYAAQAAALRDAAAAADTVLALWREALDEVAEAPVGIERSVDLPVQLPAHRLMPVALVAPDRQLVVTAVCGARTLAEGRPPMGIALAQQDVSQVYALPDDPERCLEDFSGKAAEHARRLREQLDKQDASVRRFMELNGDDGYHATG
jgi:hypothetical protein